MSYAVLYLRPDGWWIAGSGFADANEAETRGREQLPGHVKWRIVADDSDDYHRAIALEAENA